MTSHEIELVQVRNQIKQHKKQRKNEYSMMNELYILQPLKKRAKKLTRLIQRSM